MKNPISTILFAILVFQVAALPASEDYLMQDTVIPEVTVVRNTPQATRANQNVAARVLRLVARGLAVTRVLAKKTLSTSPQPTPLRAQSASFPCMLFADEVQP